jgi:hypothetical protein
LIEEYNFEDIYIDRSCDLYLEKSLNMNSYENTNYIDELLKETKGKESEY